MEQALSEMQECARKKAWFAIIPHLAQTIELDQAHMHICAYYNAFNRIKWYPMLVVIIIIAFFLATK